MMSPESLKREAMIPPEKDADSLRYRQQGAVQKGVDENLLCNHQARVRGAEKSVLKTIKEIDLHTDESPEGNRKAESLTQGG